MIKDLVRANGGKYVNAIHRREPDVQQDQIDVLGFQNVQGFFAGGRAITVSKFFPTRRASRPRLKTSPSASSSVRE